MLISGQIIRAAGHIGLGLTLPKLDLATVTLKLYNNIHMCGLWIKMISALCNMPAHLYIICSSILINLSLKCLLPDF